MIRVVGAYAAASEQPVERLAYYCELWDDPCVDGFEIPFEPSGSRWSSDWVLAQAPAGGQHVLTLIPATMDALGDDPNFGLASADVRGRQAALQLTDAARELVVDLNSGGGQTIRAVEIHSAPSGPSTPERQTALAASLQEIAEWDWAGAAVVLEHCDAARPDGRHAKGFLPLADELTAIAAVATPTNGWGVSLNWGRLAIEARSGDVVTQIAQARDSGLLSGLIFSGASDADCLFGPAWTDAHAGLREDPGVGEPTSLLTAERLVAAREAAGRLVFDGVKVSVRPAEASLDQRLATVRKALGALDGVPGR